MESRRNYPIDCTNFFNIFKNKNAAGQKKILAELTEIITSYMNRSVFRIIVNENDVVIRFHYMSIDSYKMDCEKLSGYCAYQFSFRAENTELISVMVPELPDLSRPFKYQDSTVVTLPATEPLTDKQSYLYSLVNQDLLSLSEKLNPDQVVQDEKADAGQIYPVIYTKTWRESLDSIEDAPHELMKFCIKNLGNGYSRCLLNTEATWNNFPGVFEWDINAKYNLEGLAKDINDILKRSASPLQEFAFPDSFKFDDPISGNQLFQLLYYALLLTAKLPNPKVNRVTFSLLGKLRDAYEIEVGISPSGREEKEWSECGTSLEKCLQMAKDLLVKQREEYRKQYQMEPIIVPLLESAECELTRELRARELQARELQARKLQARKRPQSEEKAGVAKINIFAEQNLKNTPVATVEPPPKSAPACSSSSPRGASVN